MGRAPCCDKVGMKKGRWTAEEDEILTKYIQANGEGSWRSLPRNAGLLRCGKSCRLRWINYLRADVKRGNITAEEEDTIVKLHNSLGNRWSLIAAQLPGRTDNEIKNYWNSCLSRRIHCFRRLGNESKPSILIDLTKFGNGCKRRGRTARSAMKKKVISNINGVHVECSRDQNQSTGKSMNTSSEAADGGGGGSGCGHGLETELLSVNGVIMSEEEGIFISFDEVMDAADQERESHYEELGWHEGTVTATATTSTASTSEEIESGIASSNGESGEWCHQDWVDGGWNNDAAAASGDVAIAAVEDSHSRSIGNGMSAKEGEELLSWLWEDDDVLSIEEECDEKQQQALAALAAWLLS